MAWLALLTASASAQVTPSPNPIPYNRIGTLHAGIQCQTFDDVFGDSWRLINVPPGQVQLDIPVRITAVATVLSDVSCAASIGTLDIVSVTPIGLDPGTSFCFGNGGDQLGCTSCPCGNNAATTSRGGCINSSGRSARLVTEGFSSLNASDLCFRVVRAAPSSFALLYSGTAQAPNNPANPCFTVNPGSGLRSASYDGLRCVARNIIRHGGRPIDANGEVGALTNPWGFCAAAFPGHSVFLIGHTRYFQVIYRDLSTAVCMRGLNTTQGTGISFTP